MKALSLLLLFLVLPFSGFAQEGDEIGAEWNNSTSVEFPATSTDEEGNIIYNYYPNDNQYFGGNETGNEEGNEGDDVPGNDDAPINDPSNSDAYEDLIQSLSDGNAIEGQSGDLSSADYDFFFGSGDSSDFSIHISGSLVRDVLKKKEIEKIVLEGWDPKNPDLNIINWIPKTKGDLSIIAAASMVRDANIQSVTLLLDRIELTYRFKGYLLYLIPFNFNALIRVNPLAQSGERVSVSYPWYQWFLWKPLSKSELAGLLEVEVTDVLNLPLESELERQGRLFGAVADALRLIPKE